MDPVDGFIYDDETKTRFAGAASGTQKIIIKKSVKAIKGGSRVEDACTYPLRAILEEIEFEEGDLEKIEDYAFAYTEKVTKIDLSPCKKLTYLGKYSFAKFPLYTLILPQDGILKSIEEGCFYACAHLSQVTIPPSVEILGVKCFLWNYNLSSVSIATPSNLLTICSYAFESSIITQFTVPQSVIEIQSTPFSLCSNLSAIYVETGNTVFTSINGVLYSNAETKLEIFPRNYPRVAQIKDTVTTIGDQAFRGATITGVQLPPQLQRINAHAFAECASLTSISIPTTVNYIGSGALRATGLTSVTIPPLVKDVSWECFKNALQLSTVVFHDAITVIGEESFANCPLTSVILPISLTKINKYAFRGCSQLACIKSWKSLTEIDGNVFENCNDNLVLEIEAGSKFSSNDASKILFTDNGATVILMYANPSSTDITLGNEVTTIKKSAFSHRPITSISLGSGISVIEDQAFFLCESLTSISIPSSITSIGAEAFRNAKLSGSVTIDMNARITEISDYCFSSTLITSFVVPPLVTHIGINAFYNSPNLASITFSGSCLQTLNESCFGLCPVLTEIQIPSSVSSILIRAFQSESVKRVTFGASSQMTVLGSGAFMNSYQLESIVFPDNLEVIEDLCFMECRNLKSINLPRTLKVINSNAFSGCSSVTEINIPNNTLLMTIEDSALEGMPNLVEIRLVGNSNYFSVSDDYAILFDASQTEIVRYCGANTRSEFIIPNTVLRIRGFAFDSALFLKKVEIPNSVSIIGIKAFQGCSNLSSLNITHNITIAASAFQGCEGLLCGSVSYPRALYDSLVVTGIPLEALHKCITREFTPVSELMSLKELLVTSILTNVGGIDGALE